MPTRRFIIGNNNDRIILDRLLTRNTPWSVSYTRMELLSAYVERLHEAKVRGSDDCEFVKNEFLQEMQTDMRERVGNQYLDCTDYLTQVEAALKIFDGFLEAVDALPLSPQFEIHDGPTKMSAILLKQ